MNTTVKALQDLYVKLGGNLTDTYAGIANGEAVGNYVTIPDMIEAVTQKTSSGGGGGSALPAVTADDNGKALLVSEGAWDKGYVPFEIVHVPFTVTADGQGNISGTTTVTFAIIKGYIDAGKIVFADATVNGEYTLIAPCTAKQYGENNSVIVFSTVVNVTAPAGKPTLYQIVIGNDESVSVTATELT